MPAEVTLAQLADIDGAVNSIGTPVGGEWVRDRWNQRAVVTVTDAAPQAEFVSHSLHNVWRRGNAKLGTATGNETGPDYVIPQ